MADLVDLARLAVQEAMEAGSDWADAAAASGRSTTVSIQNSSIGECTSKKSRGLGIRAFVNGGTGAATATTLTEAAAKQAGQQAAAMAKATHGDPEFVALPEPQPWQEVPDRFDDEVAGMASDEVVEWCQMSIDEAKQVAAEAAVSGGAGLGAAHRAIVSSTGIEAATRGTSLSMSITSVIPRGDDVGAYFEFDNARQLGDFEPEGIGRKATEEALNYLGARQISGERKTLILSHLPTNALVGSAISAASAEDIQRQRSFMMGTEGKQIASECLTVREEPLVPAGLSSSAFDGEGVPKTPRTLIDEGVLTTYLHNSYTANKAGVENTAHASRGSHSATVGIGVSNLQIEPGDRPQADLIAETDDGIYIGYGGLQPDTASGDISATIDFGLRIEDGELTDPVATTMIGSNALEMLGNIDAVSSDYRQEPGIIIPSLRIRDVLIVGGE